MSIPISIEKLLDANLVESTRIEYKKDFNPTTILHSICAFANDIDNIGGGYIIVGVEEENGMPKRPIKGLAKNSLDAVQKQLLQFCHYIEPLYQPVAEIVQYQGVDLLMIWVPGGYGRPYKAPKDATSQQSVKVHYIRKCSSSVIASSEEERELFQVSSHIPFDDQPCLVANVQDLDIGLLREYLKSVNSDLYVRAQNMTLETLAADMHLLSGPPEQQRPLNAGILMFSENPQQYFPYARIEIVEIPDPGGSGMKERIFTGPIQRQLRDAVQYLKNNVVQELVLKKKDVAEAERISNYPFRAIEELLANAVYHRSYQIYEPITVRITKEYLEITSHPGFDKSIEDEDIVKLDIRSRVYRNRRIGDFLKELRLIEGRNTGFPNTFQAIKENGSPMLKITMNKERDFLSVTLPIHPQFLPKQNKLTKEQAYYDDIVAILRNKPCMLTELALAMGYKGISARLRNAVQTLSNSGRITTVIVEGKVKFTAR